MKRRFKEDQKKRETKQVAWFMLIGFMILALMYVFWIM